MILALLTAALLAGGPGDNPSRGALTRGTWAITNVDVIPMTDDTIMRNATVLVRDGRIAAVGAAGRVRVPAGARRIDGRGKYLIPGLADMHTHLYADDDAPDSVAGDELGVMIANGVTATRLMIGTPQHLALRREIEAGRLLGPQLWIASPQLTGDEEANSRRVRTAQEARDAVREVAAAGYDFVKLTTDITPEVFDAIVQEARAQNIRVVGHVDPRVGVPRALAAGQHIEHLDDYMEQVLADSAPTRVSVSNYGVGRVANWVTLDWVDDAKVERIAGLTARSGTFTTPTISMFKSSFAEGIPDALIHARPDWNLITPPIRSLYLRARDNFWRNPPTAARRTRYAQVRDRLVRAIADSGGIIMAGSDTPEWFNVYGFALHRELDYLVQAGLTPWQALAAATRNPARFVGATAEWGSIAPGRRADLVLVDGNPLENIRNTSRISGVSMGGRWLPKEELDRLVSRASDVLEGRATEQNSPHAAVDALLAADSTFGAAASRTDVIAGLSAMFADNVVMMLPGRMPADGKTAALEALRGNADNARSSLTWRPVRGGISGDGQHGFTYGYMTLRRPDNSTVPMKYLAYWVKQADGWRVAAYKRRPRPAGEVPLTRLTSIVPPAIVRVSNDAAATERFRQSLADAEKAFSDESQTIGLGRAFVRYGSPEAMNMGGPADTTFVIGNQRIGAMIGSDGDSTTSSVNWAADIRTIVASSGDMGVTIGVIKTNERSADGTPRQTFPFFTVWRRPTPAQPWRYIAE